MNVTITVKIDEDQLIREMIKSLDMEFALDENFVEELDLVYDKDLGQLVIYHDGEMYDERGDMLAAICYLICSNYPNMIYRDRFDELYTKAYRLNEEGNTNDTSSKIS